MATSKDTSSYRKRTRKSPGGRASSTVPPQGQANGRTEDEATQRQLLQALQQIWLAGMGAMARGRPGAGPAAFQNAVAEGLRLLNLSRSAAQGMVRDAFESAQETLQARAGTARGQAQETIDNIEALFQNRVQRVMRQMGVPTAEEIGLLTRRVSELNGRVAELTENVRQLHAGKRVSKASRPSGATKRPASPAKRRVQKGKRTSTAANRDGAEEVT